MVCPHAWHASLSPGTPLLHCTSHPIHPPPSTCQVLADLGKTTSDFRQLATKALDQLCSGLMPRLRPVLDEVAGASYELTEADLAPGGGGGASPWPHALLLAFSVHLAWLQPLLTPNNYDALVHLVLDKARWRCGVLCGG